MNFKTSEISHQLKRLNLYEFYTISLKKMVKYLNEAPEGKTNSFSSFSESKTVVTFVDKRVYCYSFRIINGNIVIKHRYDDSIQ